MGVRRGIRIDWKAAVKGAEESRRVKKGKSDWISFCRKGKLKGLRINESSFEI